MKILRTAMLSAMALCFAASLVLADEVLYCTDTAGQVSSGITKEMLLP
jgi:hypothetical protein